LIKPLSIKHYALLFTMVIILLFSGYGLYTYYGVKDLKSRIQSSTETSAERELKKAIDEAYRDILEHTEEYAQWDEVRQQINNPLYYAYWKSHRSLTAGNLPKYVLDIAVYDKSGQVLAKLDQSHLPYSIDPASIEPYVDIQSGTIQLVITEPVRISTEDDNIIGYIATRSDMKPELVSIVQFSHIASTSISITPDTRLHLAISEVYEHLTFELNKNPMLDDLVGIITNAVFRMAAVMVILTLLFYPLVTYLIGRPLTQISRHVDRLRESSASLTLQSFSNRLPVAELEKVRSSLNEYHSRLYEVHNTLDESNKELWRLAHHDALTGVLNRRAFDEHWKSLKDIFADSRFEICMAIFDINNFKGFNDTYGHQVGDEVIKAIAASITSVLRDGEHLYRLGGDEFSTIFVNCEPSAAISVAERCQHAVAQYPFHELGIREPVTISIGISRVSPGKHEQLSDIQWQADVAMYSAKQPGNTSIAVFSEEMRAGAKGLFSSWIHNAVYEAIADGVGLEIYYQPIIELATGRVAYFEALLRIVRDDEIIMPIDVFRLVETKRLELQMDSAILKKIYSDLESGVIPTGTGVSINISGPSIVQPEILEYLTAFIKFMGSYKLVLEVTETALITQIEEASQNLQLLQGMGFLIALDDFGSGYSSVSYLANMPVDIVKFDITLIRCLNIEHLANMIIATGHQLIAEGIETDAMQHDVTAMGFNYGQGYLFGKPALLDEST
jgi:diguanylate cyclase (GGDEF)-like protein